MAWKKLPIISQKTETRSRFTQDQLINLDNIVHCRNWVDGDNGSTEETVCDSISGRQYIIDMPIEELETKLNVDSGE